jgi:hypothetical protein
MLLLNTASSPGDFDYTDSFRIQAAMLYPDDVEKARHHYALLILLRITYLENELYNGKISPSSITKAETDISALKGIFYFGRPYKDFWNHCAFGNELNTPKLRLFQDGTMAGDVLWWIIRLAKHYEFIEKKRSKASIAKAAYMLSFELKSTPVMAKNERVIRKAWRKYKDVAHLWLACRYTRFELDKERWFDPALKLILPQYIDEICSYSLSFLRFAASHSSTPYGYNPEKLVDIDETIFPNISLKFLKNREITVPPLNASEVQYLESYKNS